MSLLIHPMFEMNAVEPSAHISSRICERKNLFTPESVRSSAFTDFRASSVSGLPTYFWGNSNISNEFVKPVYENEFSKANAYKNLRTFEKIPRPVVGCPSISCKSTDLWRPFLSPPRDEAFQSSCVLESRKSLSNLPVIIPSTVKIGSSKTSVFEPVKKKKYTCLNCSSAFSKNVQLKSHMRKHKGVKPYKCEYPNCLKTFARNEELTRHRRIHSGYKPYHCHVCGKSFCRKDHLSKHLKTHLQISEKRIYVCCVPGCEHRYTRSDALTRHKSAAHSIRTLQR